MILPILQALTLVAIAIVSFFGRDKEKPKTIPLIITVLSITALVFGFGGYYTKSRSERIQNEKINIAVNPPIEKIIRISQELYSTLAVGARKGSISRVEIPTETEIKLILENLSPEGASPLISIPINRAYTWLEYIDYQNQQLKMAIEEMMRMSSIIDPDLLHILQEIDDCYHFKEIHLLCFNPPKKENLAFIPFIEYQKKMNRLIEYHNNL